MGKDNKKIVVIALAVLVCLFAVAGLVWWSYQQVTYKVYTMAKDGFQIKYPKGWQVRVHPKAGVIAVFVSPKENKLDTFLENYNISFTDLKDPSTLEEYVKVTEAEMKALMPNSDLLESVSARLGGHEGHKFVFQTAGDPSLTIVFYAFLHNDTAYNITYVGTTEKYLEQKRMFDEIMSSLKVYF